MSAKTTYLTRHFEAESNVHRILSMSILTDNYHITEKGREDGKKAAAGLVGKIDMIIASDFFRAHESAEVIASVTGAEVRLDTRLRELQDPHLDGLAYGSEAAIPYSERLDQAVNGEETLRSAGQRMKEAIEYYNTRFPDKRILFVSHGDPILAYLWLNAGRPAKEIDNMHYPLKGEVIRVELPSRD